MYRPKYFLIFLVIAFLFGGRGLLIDPVRAQSDDLPFDLKGHFAPTDDPSDSLPDEERRSIKEEIRMNRERLWLEGKISLTGVSRPVLQWPTRKASGLLDFHIGQISSYVDQNPAFPNQVLDWNCGMRTYDLQDGYNHQGVDINSFQFPWKRMYQNEVEAVAAADGVIVAKADGNFDRNCSTTTGGALNRVNILHADGSETWYLHLKNGSVTSKEIGESVKAGEYLGIAGSSGRSSVPHLHLEVYNAAGQLQEPFQGPCNSMNGFSWWALQETYRNPRINSLLTGSDVPSFPACPAKEITNEKIVFQPGENITVSAHIRDILVGQEIQFSILRPDASTFQSWSVISTSTSNASFRFANWTLGSGAPVGTWKYVVNFNGVTYERNFYVGQPPPVDVSGRIVRHNGTGISKARVVAYNSAGDVAARALSSPFGYFNLVGLNVGQEYRFEVVSKRYAFNERTIMLPGEISALDFTSR